MIVREHGSGASRARRPYATRSRRRSPATLVVVRKRCLALRLNHLLAVIEADGEGAHFQRCARSIDVSAAGYVSSRFSAPWRNSNALISERTKAGIRAAKSKGKLSGNPRHPGKTPRVLAKDDRGPAAYGVRIHASAGNGRPFGACERITPGTTSHGAQAARRRIDARTSSPSCEVDGV
ncbi:hypothetical protein [Agrobacterium tumefaciens]|uniref:hypothetical protein n=1 Tax=Agrobacterium tumefaciens TaxID=358 RepID=UPI0021CE81FE|nr:hypothetical protein [Agrobacterium tumefaciens]